ncbi:MAG: HupE/UreJ family protein [Rhizobiaceae bacterium]
MQEVQAISVPARFIRQFFLRKSYKLVMAITFMCWLVSVHAVTQVQAHEVRPAVCDVEIRADDVLLEIKLPVEPLLAEIDLSKYGNTDDAPQSSDNDVFRALDAAELEEAFRKRWPEISRDFDIRGGDQRIELNLEGIEVFPEPNLELPRDSRLTLAGRLPEGEDSITIGWSGNLGSLIVRQKGEGGYTGYLVAGQRSSPISAEGASEESKLQAFWHYVQVGFVHIIPAGLDHILFVLGLFFYSTRLRPLVIQVTTFTIAHTITLALATLDLVNISASVVEPLIAASIVYVGVENIFGRGLTKSRILVVFCFGLLHGLGFASVLGEVGLDPGRFVTSLVGFNIGVEIGQLSVILIAFILLEMPFGKYEWYRSRIAVPASAAISVIGAYWFFERVFG